MADPGLETAIDQPVSSAEEDDQEQRRRRIAFLIIAVIVALLIWWLLSHLATVPNTIGMSTGRARSLIHFAGFDTSMTVVPADEKQAGQVLVQSPPRGLYFTFWPVHLAVGSEAVAGNGAERDVAFLIDTGSSGIDLAVPEGQTEVMPTDPEEMAPLYYPPRTWDLLMPDVQNLTKSEAFSILRGVGLEVTSRVGPSTTDVAKDRIYYQKPAPGSEIHAGDAALLWVSDGGFNILSGKDTGYWYPRPIHEPGE